MWWGVAAALLANALYSTGFVLEKRALGALPQVSVRQPLRLLRLVRLANVARNLLSLAGVKYAALLSALSPASDGAA